MSQMSVVATSRELKAHFVGLANPTRLAIVALLAGGEMAASEVARRLKLSQPLLSWHLRVMRRAGLIATRRRGREISCGLDLEAIREIQERFNDLIGMPGARLGAAPARRHALSDPVSKETANAI